MLSLEACRKILGEDAPADERQLEQQREDAYRLARLLMEIFRAEKDGKGKEILPGEAESEIKYR
ncbi:MAG TPA: hypothetical protein VHN15_03645 [Thermoanaerobaculia bacterium]|nr:hypothetical protein [Thermoanaerobaculia bacterium]